MKNNNKTIVKNSIFLYIRMFLTMAVTLYTSRIVLNTLGIDDYGIYSIVGGVVALFGFFNAAMSSSTQRYLSFDIGQQDDEKLHKTFNSTFLIHIGIALLILLFAETIGLWYINNGLNVSQEKIITVNWVYQFSILTSLIGVIQVPFNALIIARERMNVFAMISVVDVVLKLIIVYILLIVNYNKLIAYSILVFGVTFFVALAYRIYCYSNFQESKFKFFKDKQYYKELLVYSGWNLFGNIATVAKGQGINLVLNVFFGTVVNAAYGITLQVQNAVSVFVNNFQLAVNPQIVKSYSQGDINRTHQLIFQSSKYSFFLMLIITLPILLNTEYILTLWLKTPPPYTVSFVQLCLVNVLIDCISGPLMVGAQATGKIKLYQIIIGTMIFFNLPFSYFFLKISNNFLYVYYVSIVISIFSLIFRLLFLKKILKFDIINFIKGVLAKIFLVSISTLLIFSFIKLLDLNVVANIVFLTGSTIILILFLGLNREEFLMVKNIFINKLKK